MKECVLPTTMAQDSASKFFSVCLFFPFYTFYFSSVEPWTRFGSTNSIFSTSVKCYWIFNFSAVVFVGDKDGRM